MEQERTGGKEILLDLGKSRGRQLAFGKSQAGAPEVKALIVFSTESTVATSTKQSQCLKEWFRQPRMHHLIRAYTVHVFLRCPYCARVVQECIFFNRIGLSFSKEHIPQAVVNVRS